VARPLRIAIPGGLYHVIARGNDRQLVYLDERDRRSFLELLAAVVERYRLLCHSYCLMDNHYHLLLETPLANLSLAMRQQNGLYAQRFNRRNGRCGHVFQARFRAILVQKESHLLRAARYIVRNPVRAGICAQPGQWPWSSYQALAGSAPAQSFLCTDELLAAFAPTRRSAQARYRAFVAEGLDEALLEEVRGERLGEESFLRVRYADDEPLKEIPRIQLEPLRRPLAEIFATVQRPVAAAYRDHGYSLREIGEHLGCHYSTVSRRLRREEAAMWHCKT
jgi:REP-associated tyrosine transposase